ncbi:MAG: 4-(cytidine 5'-diphospho)-2-C-methyl-D-erythritol kinase [Chitinophagia bacterium]|nr:4-(cytidine 5'-diphospho)-2-C-methyl-D-erythritol kinase [Chitinophagia bacterium]
MLCFPNCKINIGLYITNKRSDGYHSIETLFYPVAFTDALELIPLASGAEPELHLTGLPVAGSTEGNLVMKAYRLLAADFPNTVKPVAIHLHKAIPMGAGLGGGSADGAYMLTMLNRYFNLELSIAQLAAYALRLGSDCPFFIYNQPMWGSGRGEELSLYSLDLSPYSLQIVCPEVSVNTALAYSLVKPLPAPDNFMNLPQLPVNEWRNRIVNHFEAPIFERFPALSAIKERLYEQGAIYASMSGSGSAIYGIFPKGQKASLPGERVIDLP